jgi:hypothetical protein
VGVRFVFVGWIVDNTYLGNNPSESTWHRWIQKGSPLSLEDFLRPDFNQAIDQPKLRPWPEPAIEAYISF